MILMASILVIGFLLLIFISLAKGTYLYDVRLEISIKGINFSFKAKEKNKQKEKSSHPSQD